MPIDEAGVLAAMDAGIAEASAAPAATPTPPAGDDDADTTATGADGVQASADGEGDAAGEEGASGTAGGDEPADGDAADGDGVSGDGDAAAADADAEKAAAEAADTKKQAEGDGQAAQPKDPLNDPLPNALKKETKERINSLIGMVKEKDTLLTTATRERDELMGYIRETNSTPEQYGQALGYLKLVNSPNRADREQALQFLQQEMSALARMLGKPVPGVNMLEGHQDLIDEVSTGRLSPERAQEIAAARAQAHFERMSGERKQHEQQLTQQQLRERNEGVQALNTLEAQLKATEPAVYAAKRKVLIESLRPVFKQIHPTQWAATFKRAYDALPAPAAPRVPTPTPQPRVGAPAGGGGNTPLRAHQPAGSARPEPKSLLDAINAGISEAR